MPDWGIVLLALAVVFVLAYVPGFAAGRSSGKVDAIEQLHDVDLSGGDADD